MKRYVELINKSIGAALLISLGNFALLKLGNPIGPVIFSLGLLGVCYMGLNLFTGKCGFIIQDKIKITDLLLILLFNLIGGYLIGLAFSVTDSTVFENSLIKVATWSFSTAFFIKSVLCGIIMYIAVYMYKKGTSLGILFGIPLFIFSGFQHCIANIITLGVARTFSWTITICILGNFLGSLFMSYLSREIEQPVITKKRGRVSLASKKSLSSRTSKASVSEKASKAKKTSKDNKTSKTTKAKKTSKTNKKSK
jgi:formate/nitrite transporter FocA (FNT family)